MRRLVLWGLLVPALAGAGAYAYLGPRGDAAEASYRLARADRGPITASVRATGTVNPVTTVLVGSQLSGQVTEILVDYNSPVKAGQVLARIYAEQIKARREAARADLEQARSDIAMRRAQLQRSRATRQRAESTLKDQLAQRDRVAAQLAEARRGLERQTELIARSVGAQTALDAARTQVEIQAAGLASAEAQIAAQRAELGGLDADIALAEAQAASADAALLQRQAKLREVEIDLERTEIRSPVDGVVVKRDIDLGQTVAASLSAPTLFTVAQDLRRIDIWANIDEADVGRVVQGQRVSFTVNAYPTRSFDGQVRMVRLGSQTVQNVVTYTAVIGVENPDMALLPGMTANLQIVTDERRDVLRVPNAALRFRPPGAAPQEPRPPGGLITAAASPDEGGRPRGGRAAEALRERIVAEVAPTPDQLARIDAILAEARSGAPGREPGASDEERRAAARAFRQELARRIAATLDPERRARYEALLAEGRGRAEARRGERPRDPGLPGRVFVPGPGGQPAAVALRLGVSDGAVTEVLAGDLPPDAQVIVGGGPKPPAAQDAPPPRPRGPRPF